MWKILQSCCAVKELEANLANINNLTSTREEPKIEMQVSGADSFSRLLFFCVFATQLLYLVIEWDKYTLHTSYSQARLAGFGAYLILLLPVSRCNMLIYWEFAAGALKISALHPRTWKSDIAIVIAACRT